MGIERATTDFAEAVGSADLIILSTPVGVMADMVERIIAAGNTSALITDVGSVKRLPHETIRPLLESTSLDFIGSHPMAGSEQAGIEAARVDLVDGAACIITNEDHVSSDKEDELQAFWEALGCRVRRLSAEDHDYAIARISHFPHMLASVGATVGLAFEDIGELSGGGLRDTTRVASGDAGLWTEILMENRDALQRSLNESVIELTKVQEMLCAEDRLAMHAYLEEAKRRRDQI